jgi:uncharacterized protein YbjQ (UPF0145 family)
MSEGILVSGHVVIAQDYFKSFLASLVNITGGRVTSYESLLDRGRREALCRMRESAKAWGCDQIVIKICVIIKDQIRKNHILSYRFANTYKIIS